MFLKLYNKKSLKYNLNYFQIYQYGKVIKIAYYLYNILCNNFTWNIKRFRKVILSNIHKEVYLFQYLIKKKN